MFEPWYHHVRSLDEPNHCVSLKAYYIPNHEITIFIWHDRSEFLLQELEWRAPQNSAFFSACKACNLLHMSIALPENSHTIGVYNFKESFHRPSATKKHKKQKINKIITARTYISNFFSRALARETAPDWLN